MATKRTAEMRRVRNCQIVAARLRHAADLLDTAFAELDGADLDARTSGIKMDFYADLELGREPTQMIQSLQAYADQVLRMAGPEAQS